MIVISPQLLPRIPAKDVTPFREAPIWVKALMVLALLLWAAIIWFVWYLSQIYR